MSALTPKQQRFVEEYLIDLNGSAAYRRAGYRAKNDRVARTEAARLLANPSVAEALAAARQARSERTKVTADQVLRELARIAFLDPRTVVQWGPDGVKLLDSRAIGADAAAAVAEVGQTVTESGGSLKVKFCDKVAALEKLGRHLGLFKDQVELTGVAMVLVEEIIDPPGDRAGADAAGRERI